MNGSNGRIESLLERIAESQEATREELSQLRADMNRGFLQVNTRIDNALAIGGGHHADHELRIRALEAEVFEK